MGIGSDLQELGQFLDDCERSGEAVGSVDLARVTDADGEGICGDLELRLSVDLSDANEDVLCDPRLGPDGTLRFALESTRGLFPAVDHDVDIEPTETTMTGETVTVSFAASVPATTRRLDDDGADRTAAGEDAIDETPDENPANVTTGGCSFDETTATDRSPARERSRDESVGSEREERAGSEQEGRGGEERDEYSDGRDYDVPPFKNPDLLANVYESCETFAEMADELDMEVTAETVRRYMIDYDIHEPDSYRTGGTEATEAATGDDGQPVVLSDGIGLPDDVTVDTLVETVKRSNTIYEVKQDIDVDRDDALEMLQELNLLDVVMGRLATEGERDITREDIVERLRDASSVQ